MLNYKKVFPQKHVPTCWAALWLFNIAKEHGPFIYEIYDVLPLENADFP